MSVCRSRGYGNWLPGFSGIEEKKEQIRWRHLGSRICFSIREIFSIRKIFFKINFLHDKIIFFAQVFFPDKVWSYIFHFWHPPILRGHLRDPQVSPENLLFYFPEFWKNMLGTLFTSHNLLTCMRYFVVTLRILNWFWWFWIFWKVQMLLFMLFWSNLVACYKRFVACYKENI